MPGLGGIPRAWTRSRPLWRACAPGSRTTGRPERPPARAIHPSAPRRWSAAALLQRLERARPVLLEEARQGPIGEQLSAGLAGRAVVRLVLGVDDPLDGRPAHRARLAVAPVHGHVVAERRHLLREALPDLSPDPIREVGEGGPGGDVETRQLLLAQLVRHPDR